VTFTVDIGKSLIKEKVRVTKVLRQDDSGESWIFEGYAIPEEGRNLMVMGWFCTGNRKGHIKYEN
jgi:hypothetical protein